MADLTSTSSPAAASLERRLALDLLRIGAVALQPDHPFTWASGLRAPIYCDNRLTMAYPDVRRRIAEGFAALLAREGLGPDVVVGTATAGIPHAAWLAERLDLPMAYVRARPKEHGRGNQIEGRLDAGATAVLVEDLISTGTSSLGAVEAIRRAGGRVAAVVGIFSYGLPAAAAAFAEAGLPLYTLTGYRALIEAARAAGDLPEPAFAALAAWQRDPQAWSAARGGG